MARFPVLLVLFAAELIMENTRVFRRESVMLTHGVGAGLDMEMDRTDACGGG